MTNYLSAKKYWMMEKCRRKTLEKYQNTIKSKKCKTFIHIDNSRSADRRFYLENKQEFENTIRHCKDYVSVKLYRSLRLWQTDKNSKQQIHTYLTALLYIYIVKL
jgi:hypothetical protein